MLDRRREYEPTCIESLVTDGCLPAPSATVWTAPVLPRTPHYQGTTSYPPSSTAPSTGNETDDLAAARRRIQQLEANLQAQRRLNAYLREELRVEGEAVEALQSALAAARRRARPHRATRDRAMTSTDDRRPS